MKERMTREKYKELSGVTGDELIDDKNVAHAVAEKGKDARDEAFKIERMATDLASAAELKYDDQCDWWVQPAIDEIVRNGMTVKDALSYIKNYRPTYRVEAAIVQFQAGVIDYDKLMMNINGRCNSKNETLVDVLSALRDKNGEMPQSGQPLQDGFDRVAALYRSKLEIAESSESQYASSIEDSTAAYMGKLLAGFSNK